MTSGEAPVTQGLLRSPGTSNCRVVAQPGLTFIAIVVPGMRNRPALAAAVVAGVVSILAFGLEFKLGLIVAAIAGIVAGGLAERVLARE